MRPGDFLDFWKSTIEEAGACLRDVRVVPSDYAPAGMLEGRWDVSWTGWAGIRVGGWLWKPMTCKGRLPAVVYFPGYGGQVWDRSDFARRGFVAFAASPRGGTLSDPEYRENVPSMLTHGITAPAEYAFRGAYVDAVQAMSFVRGLAEVDCERVYAMGASCGAALAIAAAALGRGVRAVSAECPFMTDFPYVADHVQAGPYGEVVRFVKDHQEMREAALSTLAYFDTVSLAPEVNVPTILSYGEADVVCPPATIRRLFDALRCVKAIVAYPGRTHDRGGDFLELSLRWFETHS
ncbi:MAG: acetylxylan esterase [Planctomycetota bacterium]